MLADLVLLGGNYPYTVIAGVALICAAAIWRGTR
jgi:hypothetical protein